MWGMETKMKNRLINNRKRPVTSVPHAGNQQCLIQTGIGFNGVQICLLVPAGKHPPDVVKEFVADFAKMHKRSNMTTLNDRDVHGCWEVNNG